MMRFLGMALAGLLACAAAARADNTLTIGGEVFRDRYEEPYNLRSTTDYGSVTLGDKYDLTPDFFVALQGRYSRGTEDYRSDSGALNGIPDREGEARLLGGINAQMWHGVMMPYIGIGGRLYFDQGKGRVSSLDKLFYDRHITQAYMPIGVTYRMMFGSWTVAPNIEFDPLLYGRVSSHLAPLNAQLPSSEWSPNFVNIQHNGYGLRGELMVGQQYKYFGWEIGPFVRYWDVQDSNFQSNPYQPGYGAIEPKNTRLQTGAALRVNF